MIPIYEVFPVAKLTTDEYLADSCLNLSVGKNGSIAGGYANGILALWNLNNFSSPFNDAEEKSTIMRPHLTIQAHKTTVTGERERERGRGTGKTGKFTRLNFFSSRDVLPG